MKKLLTLGMLLASGGLLGMNGQIISGVPTPANLPQPTTNTTQMKVVPSAIAPEHVMGEAMRTLVNAAYEFVRTNGSKTATEALHHAAMNYVAHHNHHVGNSVIMPGPVMPTR